MPLDPDYIMGLSLDPIRTSLTDRDAMFYALSIGLGRDPLDPWDLGYVYEKELKVFPTMPIVIGHPGNWMADPRTGITRSRVVHGAQRLELFRPLPIGGSVTTTNRVTHIWDKNDKGAVLDLLRETYDDQTGALVARSGSSVFCRADGGFGGLQGEAQAFKPVPDRAADIVATVPTEPNMALIYRLNNDRNPLHAEPAFAARAGFSRPILHGLATYGLAAVAIARHFSDRQLAGFEARFSKPVVPGDTIEIDIWPDDEEVAFRARVGDQTVLDRGRARWESVGPFVRADTG